MYLCYVLFSFFFVFCLISLTSQTEFFHFNYWSEHHQATSPLHLLDDFYMRECPPEINDSINHPTIFTRELRDWEVHEPASQWSVALEIPPHKPGLANLRKASFLKSYINL